FGAIACEAYMLKDPRTPNRDEVAKRAGANLREFYRAGAVREFEAEILASVALGTGQPDLARLIVAEWGKLTATDKSAHRRRADFLLKAGDFLGAAEAAAKAPDDPEAQKIRKDALDQIEMFLKKQR